MLKALDEVFHKRKMIKGKITDRPMEKDTILIVSIGSFRVVYLYVTNSSFLAWSRSEKSKAIANRTLRLRLFNCRPSTNDADEVVF